MAVDKQMAASCKAFHHRKCMKCQKVYLPFYENSILRGALRVIFIGSSDSIFPSIFYHLLAPRATWPQIGFLVEQTMIKMAKNWIGR
ncbi:hypothetical protein Gotur_014436 [Gossypium turneri]